MPGDARSAILAAVRKANGRSADLAAAEAEYAQITPAYARHTSLSHEAVLELLTDRLIDYNAHVVPCTPEQIPSAIRDALAQHGSKRILVPEDLPRDLLPEDFEVTPDTALSPAELNAFDAAVTLSTLAIAETGTLVLQGLTGQGRRAATLVPDVHICILHARDIVATVPEAFERLAGTATNPLTFVSGPSATADIEMTRIKGVHGPRQLHILLVGETAEAFAKTL